MKNIIIVPPDGLIVIDGVAREIPVSGPLSKYNAVRYDAETKTGEAESADQREIIDLLDCDELIAPCVALWEAAAPSPKTFSDMKNEARQMVRNSHALIVDNLTGNYSVEERDTWPIKVEAARAVKTGTATAEQELMIALECEKTGETPDELADVILAKNAATHIMIGLAAGHRRRTEAAVDAAETDTELMTVLRDAEAEVPALIARLKELVDVGSD
jgi:hypothetical protein